MRIVYRKRNKRLQLAVEKTNEILETSTFYEAVINCKTFDNSKLSPKEIGGLIKDYRDKVYIRTYWNPFGRANAKTGNGTKISVNTAKLRRSKKSIVNTLVHEYVHCVDFGTKNKEELLRFTHYDNRNDGDENNTAPWKIGRIASLLV